jgi:AcrR family transcriptional regulator
MGSGIDPKREAILTAAFAQFSQYGLRKTSMEDIARAVGISRASLYSHFENKDAIFRCLAERLHEDTLGDAETRLKQSPDTRSLATRVEAALLARYGRLQEVVTRSAHGSEIVDENNRLCGDLVSESAGRFHAMLTNAMKAGARSGEVDLKAAGLSAPAAAELIQLGASGLKQGSPDPATFAKRLHGFVRVFFAGLRRADRSC